MDSMQDEEAISPSKQIEQNWFRPIPCKSAASKRMFLRGLVTSVLLLKQTKSPGLCVIQSPMNM